MGAIRMRVHKNITIIHSTPVHQLMSWEWNAVCLYGVLTSNSPIHNNSSSSENVIWSESGEKSAQQVKTVQNSTKHMCGLILM